VGALLGTSAGQVWVEDTGGAGVPLVLLHPGITDSSVWDRLVPLLGDRRVVRFDRPGYGRSPRATTAQRPVDQLIGVLDALELDRVHLVGNSNGGGTSLALAVSQPARVASMTLLCTAVPGFPWPADAGDPEVDAEYERHVASKDVEGLTDLYLRVFAAQGRDDHLVAQVRETTELELSGEDLTESNPEVWGSVPDLDVPTAVVVGDRDDPDTVLADLALADALPGAELVRLDVDHLPQYRDPDAVAEVVLRTVARAEGRG
jgi:pimeloyl-ACP methyl ester carboxylesterase